MGRRNFLGLVGAGSAGLLGAVAVNQWLSRSRSAEAVNSGGWGSSRPSAEPGSGWGTSPSASGWGATDGGAAEADSPASGWGTPAPDSARFSHLEELLQQQDWAAADQETLKLMLAIINQEEQAYLAVKSLATFPCEALRQIDRLWLAASDRKFGFSVQRAIYLDCGGQPDGNYDPASWRCFAQTVGWRIDENWAHYGALNFTLAANPGHLPGIVVREIDGGKGMAGEQMAALIRGMDAC